MFKFQDPTMLDSADNGIRSKIQLYMENYIFKQFLEAKFPGNFDSLMEWEGVMTTIILTLKILLFQIFT